MKRKYLVATHGKLASGIRSSIGILAGKEIEINVIDAYVTDEDYTPKIEDFINQIKEDEQGIIFTDLYGGSVNQKIVTLTLNSNVRDRIKIITNANLAIVLSVIFADESKALTDEQIENLTNEAKVTLVNLQPKKEENEDDAFFS